jgi:rubrerythrin
MSGYYEAYIRQTQKLVEKIQKAINGEYSAIQCYKKLANLAPNSKVGNQILEIRKDEINHCQQFTAIYSKLTGQQPTYKITEVCPETYRDGLDFAFQDEQETVAFYLGIAEESQDSTIKEAFRNAAADEQNHAVWFLYYMK